MRYFLSSQHHCNNTIRLKKLIDPIDFYTHEGQEIASRGQGKWKLAGLCPFHEDRNAGSFYINIVNGAFHCFSCNASGGDIISFVQKKYEMSFREVLEKLIREWMK